MFCVPDSVIVLIAKLRSLVPCIRQLQQALLPTLPSYPAPGHRCKTRPPWIFWACVIADRYVRGRGGFVDSGAILAHPLPCDICYSAIGIAKSWPLLGTPTRALDRRQGSPSHPHSYVGDPDLYLLLTAVAGRVGGLHRHHDTRCSCSHRPGSHSWVLPRRPARPLIVNLKVACIVAAQRPS